MYRGWHDRVFVVIMATFVFLTMSVANGKAEDSSSSDLAGSGANRLSLDSGSWVNLSLMTYTPTSRTAHTAFWTGDEMIVWSGSGARYNPSTNRWKPISKRNAASGKAVWTGTEMIVWGNNSARYNLAKDIWTTISTMGAPSSGDDHTAVWTGSEMIIWGSGEGHTAARYNPATDLWTTVSKVNQPSGRIWHTAIWTGSEMIIWGGTTFGNTGARYNPRTDTWTPTSTGKAPSARFGHTAIWTGSEMIVWGGGMGTAVSMTSGGRYNPVMDAWTSTSYTNVPDARSNHSAVWTGSEMIIWGGVIADGRLMPIPLRSGARYDPETNTWTPIPDTMAPANRFGHTAIWTGSEMIVWGGTLVRYSGRPLTAQHIPTNTGARLRFVIPTLARNWEWY